MKTAIYIEDSVVQLVLTPENNWEERALGAMHDKKINTQFFNGEFYSCQGGWIRARQLHERVNTDHADKASLIIRADIITP